MDVEGELARCVAHEYARLVAVVAVVTGATDLAEECVQEAFARAWERSQRGETFHHVAGWVVTVALNQARSGRRRRLTERRVVEKHAGEVVRWGVEGADAAIVIRAAVDGLPRRQRDAVILYYLLDIELATVANLLGIAQGTVKSALARARATLAAALADQELERW